MKINLKSKETLFFILTSLFMVIVVFFGMRSELWSNSNNNPMFARAVVLEILDDRVNINEAGAYVGSQRLKIEIISGHNKGSIVEAQNILFPIEQGVNASVGERVIAFYDGTGFAHIQSYDRSIGIGVVIVGFIILLAIIFGKSGLRAAFGLIFTFVTIIFILMPGITNGLSPGLLTIGLSILIVIVSIIAIMGFKAKTYVSILGAIIGILAYIVFYFIVGRLLKIDGFNISDIDLLIVAGFSIGARELLFSSILIASLGGIMDVAVSLGSSMYELRLSNTSLSVKELFQTGMKVSKDIIGSSSNTLILAFTGTFLVTLMLLANTNAQHLVIINRVDIGIEMLRAISASAAMLVVAPATALLGAYFYSKRV